MAGSMTKGVGLTGRGRDRLPRLSARPAWSRPGEPAATMTRISGVDVARGLAVLGMFAAHVGPDPQAGGFGSVLEIAQGAAALFALLAGVSIALLSGGCTPAAGRAGHRAATRIAVRAALLVPLGLVLTALGTDIDIILTFYGVYFLLALPALRRRAGMLAALAGALAVLAPLASYALRAHFWPIGPNTAAEDLDFGNVTSLHGLAILLFLGAYPAITYMPFVLGGMAVGRLDLRKPATARRLIAIGGALTVLGYGGSWLALHPLGGLARLLASVPSPDRGLSADQLFGGLDGVVPTTSPAWLLTSAVHSGTPFWIAGAGGIALIVLGCCLLLTRPPGRGRAAVATMPVADLGAMALTAYSLQIVAIALFDDNYDGAAAWIELALFSGAALLLATTWRRRLAERGPLETLLHVSSTKTAQVLVPAR